MTAGRIETPRPGDPIKWNIVSLSEKFTLGPLDRLIFPPAGPLVVSPGKIAAVVRLGREHEELVEVCALARPMRKLLTRLGTLAVPSSRRPSRRTN
jgi:small neutral amino acid transporter SnatA (MarC family)